MTLAAAEVASNGGRTELSPDFIRNVLFVLMRR